MTAQPIDSASLSPAFNIPTIANSHPDNQQRLLGQTRAIDAFRLLASTQDQHLFLADQNGIDRQRFIDALVKTQTDKKPQYLNRIGNNQPTDQLIWQSDKGQNNLCKTQHQYLYLSGNIKRRDLIGHISSQEHHQYYPGALACCHYLFICAESLWKREALWDLVLAIADQGQYHVHSSLPQLPLNCKIILVGGSNLYSTAYADERSFASSFPLLGELVNEINRRECSEQEYLVWLLTLAAEKNLTLTQPALTRLFSFSTRLSEHQQYLSLLTIPMSQLMEQASIYGASQQLSVAAINDALNAQINRHDAAQQISVNAIDERFINLSTTGNIIGQINGLTILDTADYSYGEPARITVTVHHGDGEVADIERKSELGGNIHAKGLLILSSCLYRIFGKDAPLHLNANIVFEQSYQEIDGDSASLAEYCALMSAIAEQPIDQGIATTGAIDQFGNVQAIGGVNQKIEGFFDLCNRRGLTGSQGVIIPKTNVQQLNLKPDVIAAVDADKFHLYQVEHIDQAVTLLMDKSAGCRNDKGQFAKDSLYGLVQDRLKRLANDPDEPSCLWTRLISKFKFSD